MQSRLAMSWLATLLVVIGLLSSACTTGGGTTTPAPGDGLSLRIITDRNSGPAPLTINFFVTPSGGTAPYTYAWDFNNDEVVDSNAPSGTFTYSASSIARVTVTDARGQTTTASQTITLTPPGTGGNPGEPAALQVAINASPQFFEVPQPVQFTAVVTGGRAPYEYAWDFDGDGVFDNFTPNPIYIFNEVGQDLGDGRFVFRPVLRITDARGVVATNLENPSGVIEINAMPPDQGLYVTASANPQSGQAPLLVEFVAATGGSSGNVEFRWSFGDGQISPYGKSSLTTHYYEAPGTYQAIVTARDIDTGQIASSAPVTIQAQQSQPFEVTISSDITGGTVPFNVHFEAIATNGVEPIQYEWVVWDNDPGNPDPGPGNPGSLAPAAVVTPSETNRKDPRIHFANLSSTAPPSSHQYRVRVSATDAAGAQRTSDFIIVTAQPHPQPVPRGRGWYSAKRPLIVDETLHPAAVDPSTDPFRAPPRFTGNAVFRSDANVPPFNPGPASGPLNVQLSPRANVAIASHTSGVTFMFGGERLNQNGQFQGLVGPRDSVYAYVPVDNESHSGNAAHGKFDDQAGGVIRLNDGYRATGPGAPFPWNWSGPGFGARGPDRADTLVPPQRDPLLPPAQPPPASTDAAQRFQIVGSAQAVMVHEPVETNDDGRYPGPGTQFPMGGDDEDFLGGLAPGYYPWPDASGAGWNADIQGTGSVVFYVLGGRDGSGRAVALEQEGPGTDGPVQKYYPYGFGNEDVLSFSQDFRFQATTRQVDIWATYWLRPDQDQWTGSGRNFDPLIQTRQGNAIEGSIPTMPVGLYGHMAVRIETGLDVPSPTFPNGPYSYVFVMGGIDNAGGVRGEMYWWDTRTPMRFGGSEEREDGVFSAMPAMPQPRAYGDAVLLPGFPLRIAVVGGYDTEGRPLGTIDVFTFDNVLNPNSGSWSTFGGTLDELVSTAAGYFPDGSNMWVLTFGGYDNQDFLTDVQTVRIDGGGIVEATLDVVPRGWHSLGQGGIGLGVGAGMQLTSNRYTIFGGLAADGLSNVLEVTSLP